AACAALRGARLTSGVGVVGQGRRDQEVLLRLLEVELLGAPVAQPLQELGVALAPWVDPRAGGLHAALIAGNAAAVLPRKGPLAGHAPKPAADRGRSISR